MQLLPDPLHAEQHDPEETGFEEEGGQHLIGHERPDHRPRFVGKDRPVGAELVGHDDAGDDPHGKADGEDFQPVFEEVEILFLTGLQPQPLEDGEIGGEADRESWEDEMEGDGERELRPRQDQSRTVRLTLSFR